MAYLDLASDPYLDRSARMDAPAQRLNSQERLVVLLSRSDPLWSLRPRQGHSRMLRFLFGIEAPHHLADPRLEALRSYAVTYRLDDASVSDAEEAAMRAGFSASQLAQVRQMAEGVRAQRRRKPADRPIAIALLTLAALLCVYDATAWLGPKLDSSLLAFVLVAVGLLSLAPAAVGGQAARQ